MNKLKGLRAYLAGAMDYCPTSGRQWRQEITPWLKERGVLVFDPTDNPIEIGPETIENREYRKHLRETGQFDMISKEMRLIRSVDLRMVDIVDFVIVSLDREVYTAGTWEELYDANRSKKPLVVRIAQGKTECPDWLFGTIPHHMIFGTWAEVYNYLTHVDGGGDCDPRWRFFDLAKVAA